MDPTLELWGAIVAALKADSTIGLVCGDRVYDHVPRSTTSGEITAKYPFIAWSGTDTLTDDADCIPSSSVSLDIDVWSRAKTSAEAYRLAAAIKTALHDLDTITLTTNGLVFLQHRQTRTFRDPDGLTTHSVLTFEADVET